MTTMEIFKRTCRSCGRLFTTTQSDGEFCSEDCLPEALPPGETSPAEEYLQILGSADGDKDRECIYCGKAFHPEHAYQLYCSLECSQASKQEEDNEKRLLLREKYGLSFSGGRTDEEKKKADMLRECKRLGITMQEAQALGIEDDLGAFEPNTGHIKNQQVLAALAADFTEGGFILTRCKKCGKPFISSAPLKKHCDACNAALEKVLTEKKRKAAESKRKEEERRSRKFEKKSADVERTETPEGETQVASAPKLTEVPFEVLQQAEAKHNDTAVSVPDKEENHIVDAPPQTAVRRSRKEAKIAPGIREARKRKDMKQKALAEALGVDVTLISRYETGKTPVPEDRLMKMSELLDVEAGELLAQKEETPTIVPEELHAAINTQNKEDDGTSAYIPCKDMKTKDGKHICDRFRIEIRSPEERCCKEGCPMYEPAGESEEVKQLKQEIASLMAENASLRETVSHLIELTDTLHRLTEEAETAYSTSQSRIDMAKKEIKG